MKKKCQEANFSLLIKNLESTIKKRILDQDTKIGEIPDLDCQPYYFYSSYLWGRAPALGVFNFVY